MLEMLNPDELAWSYIKQIPTLHSRSMSLAGINEAKR